MTDLGITVAAFTDGVTVQDVYAMIETVGQITDAQEAARRAWRRCKRASTQ
jgi:ABC-type Fe3+-hydroxamate transport system substrate-binding protein